MSMKRACRFLIVAITLVFGCAAFANKRPKVDPSAMREAIFVPVDGRFASSSAYAHFLKARMFHLQGEHRKALDELRLALATDEGNPYLELHLSEQLARIGELTHAESELHKLLGRHPKYQPAHVLMGRVLLDARKFDKARTHLRKAIVLDPKSTDGYLVMAQLELEQDHVDASVSVVEELSSALPHESMGYRRLGIALLERRDYSRAQKLLKKAVTRDEDDFDSWMGLAQTEEALERLDAAEEDYARALERDPESQEALLAAGRVALRSGSVTRAKAYFDRVLLLSDDPDLVVRVAFSYLSARLLNDAVSTLDEARKRRTGDARTAFYAGLVHERLLSHSAAEQAFSEVPDDSEYFEEARMHRAACMSLMGQHDRALKLLDAAITSKSPRSNVFAAYARILERSGAKKRAESFLLDKISSQPDAELYEALAASYQRQGRAADAVSLLRTAVQAQPQDENLIYALGSAYQRQGDVDTSLKWMRQVLQINPQNAAAMNFIGYILAERGRELEEAEALLVRALALRPDDGAFLDSLGWVYFRRGEYDRAVSILERAFAQAPGEPLIIEHLGDAYLAASRKTQARDAYQRALDALRLSGDPPEDPGQKANLERKLKRLSTEAAGR